MRSWNVFKRSPTQRKVVSRCIVAFDVDAVMKNGSLQSVDRGHWYLVHVIYLIGNLLNIILILIWN